MELYLGLAGRELEGDDPFPIAERLERTETEGLLRDLTKAGLVFVVDTLVADQALSLLGVSSRVREDGEAIAQTALDVEGLKALTGRIAYVVAAHLANDLQRLVSEVETKSILVASEMPQRVAAFGMVIKVEVEIKPGGIATYSVAKLTGQDAPFALECQVNQSRLVASVMGRIRELASGKPVVVLPRSALKEGRTSLGEMTLYLGSVRRVALRDFQMPQAQVEEQILGVLLNHTDNDVVDSMKPADRSNLRNQIAESTRRNLPVPLSLTVAYGFRAPNPLKYPGDPFGLPTFAWLYNFYIFRLMAEKVRRFYPPGLEFLVFEEGWLFHELLEVPPAVVERNLKATCILAEAVDAPVRFINLLPEHVSAEDAAREHFTPGDDEVHAYLCSMPAMTDEMVMEDLYVTERKDFAAIKRRAGRLWDEARRRAVIKGQYLAARKTKRLFQKLSGVDRAILDAAITRKEGRICLKMTGHGFHNHGETVVKIEESGGLHAWCEPGYRLQSGRFQVDPKRTWHVEPVLINPQEFGLEGEDYPFFYLVTE